MLKTDKDVKKMIIGEPTGDALENIHKEFENAGKICIFGCGWIGSFVAKFMSWAGISVDFAVDNAEEKWNQTVFDSIKCYSPKIFENYADELYIIVAMNNYPAVLPQLSKFNNVFLEPDTARMVWYMNNYDLDVSTHIDEINEVSKMLGDDKSILTFTTRFNRLISNSFFGNSWRQVNFGDPQYFPVDNFWQLNSSESFVDCGAFIGDSITAFMRNVNYEFENIYAYEMEKNNFIDLGNYINSNYQSFVKQNKIHLFNAGVSNKYDEVDIFQNDGGASTLKVQGYEVSGKAKLVPLDKEIGGGERISFIKMDIEGAEMSALEGAKKIIQEQHPKLAISIYHKPNDFWEIPLYIKTLVPEYKIYIRHHTNLDQDTVCYAVC